MTDDDTDLRALLETLDPKADLWWLPRHRDRRIGFVGNLDLRRPLGSS